MTILKKFNSIPILSIIVLLLISPIFFLSFLTPKNNTKRNFFPSRTPFNPFPYNPPKIPYNHAYRIILVGDSMIDALGNADLLREHLIELYPGHDFTNYNYGFGATTIESLSDRLNIETTYRDQKYPPILKEDIELIIIESFAYNPLPQESDGQGVAKHIQILDKNIKDIINKRPDISLALMVTIAPNKANFAKGVYDLTEEERNRWANERIEYIESTIKYANQNQIPLINVYEKSQNSVGDGDLKFINPDDYIHPSAEGINLISKNTAEFIFNNKIFPQ